MRILVAELANWPGDMTAGKELYDSIHDIVLEGRNIQLDFTGCRNVSGTFLRYAFAELFRNVNLLKFKEIVEIVEYPPAEKHILERVLAHLAESMWAETMKLRRAPAA